MPVCGKCWMFAHYGIGKPCGVCLPLCLVVGLMPYLMVAVLAVLYLVFGQAMLLQALNG